MTNMCSKTMNGARKQLNINSFQLGLCFVIIMASYIMADAEAGPQLNKTDVNLRREHCIKWLTKAHTLNLDKAGENTVQYCACAKQHMMKDYSFKQDGQCFTQIFYQNGTKLKCCYDKYDKLQMGPPTGGYTLLETDEQEIQDAHYNCCHDNDEKKCQLFYQVNPSVECSNERPVYRTSWGDPVINTIDGRNYSFNGHGEYLFLDADDGKFLIQARTDYVTKGNKDATQFVAFALKDAVNNDTLLIVLNRTDTAVYVFNKGIAIYKSTDPPIPKQTKEFQIIPGPSIHFRNLRLEGLYEISFTGGSFLSISLQVRGKKYPNTTGLAGALQNGLYIQSNGTSYPANAHENEMFAYGESWSLKNESESIFNYNLTSGNFFLYNDHHTRPRFLEDLLGNFAELFKGHTKKDIDEFQTTCTNSWNSQLNNDCLLMIARTNDAIKGKEIMDESSRIHNKYEFENNKDPVFNDTMPSHITVNLRDVYILDVASFVIDEDNATEMTYIVDTELTSQYIEHGKFNWSVTDELRTMDTALNFIVYDRFNFSANHKITIRYCGCDLKTECNFDLLQGNSSTDILEKASCHCPNKHITGDYCEEKIDPCIGIKCFINNTCDSNSTKDNPCGPCLDGYTEVFSENVQGCTDVDECSSDSSNKCQFNSNCSNTIGSYTCECGEGYINNGADSHVCDDIDECANKTDSCNGDEKCVNVDGSYRCECYPGFQKEGGKCSQIVGFSYPGYVSITIMSEIGPEKEVDNDVNRQSAQLQLIASFILIPGFVSVEVLKITIVQSTSVPGGRMKRASNQKLRVDYIIHMSNETKNEVFHESVKQALHNHHLNNTIGDIKVLSDTASVDVPEGGLCSINGQTDCDTDTTICVATSGSFACNCTSGFKRVTNSQKYCKDIDECDEWKDQMADRCVHGKCSNLIGSWNCSCPTGKIWQSVGNTSHPVYRCQGTYQYIGESTISWTSAVTYNVSDIFRSNIISTYRNSTVPLSFKSQHISMAELLVSINIVNYTETNLNATVVYEITLGEPLSVEHIIEFQNDISSTTKSFSYENFTITVITLKVFNDSEYSICNVPGKTNCETKTTKCIAANGAFTCPCRNGYEPIDGADNVCTDTNECKTIKDQCVHGKCSNLIGSWNCTCPAEKIWQSVGNTLHPVYRCQGSYQYIGETNMTWYIHNISNITEFFKTKISETYRSSSYEFIFNGSKLLMNDLLVSINILNSDPNKSDTNVFNTIIAYEITIGEPLDVQQVKYFQSKIFNSTKHFMNGGTEVVINELKIFNDTEYNLCDIDDRTQCDLLSTVCIVANGSYTCPCRSDGFRSKPSLKYTCEDINECENSYICSGGKCQNSPVGNWTCDCDPGYISVWHSQLNVTCQDIDECATKENTTQSTCINTKGSWHYQCSAGYEHIENKNNQTLCTDIDECQNASRSDAVSKCTNTEGSFYIECNQGYTHKDTANNQSKCTDINECSNTTVPACLNSVKCDNTPGAWTCECRNGVAPVEVNKTTYICGGDYKYVIDFTFFLVSSETVNETVLGQFMKEQTEIIYKTSYPTVRVELISVNIIPSRKRAAEIKTFGPNYEAKFVLHFDTQKKPADITTVWNAYYSNKCQNRTCPETDGEFTIHFSGIVADTDGTRGICSIDRENICDLDSTTCSDDNGKLNCTCKTGYKHGSHQYECKDIDECIVHNYTCSNHGICENSPGGWECNCHKGYEVYNKNTSQCINIDECHDSIPRCLHGVCNDTDGSWNCTCDTGFSRAFVNDTTFDCQDTCSSSPCENGATCNHDNNVDGYKCSCPDGITGQLCENDMTVDDNTDSSVNHLTTILIAAGSSAAALIILLVISIILIYRWKTKKIDDTADKMSLHALGNYGINGSVHNGGHDNTSFNDWTSIDPRQSQRDLRHITDTSSLPGHRLNGDANGHAHAHGYYSMENLLHPPRSPKPDYVGQGSPKLVYAVPGEPRPDYQDRNDRPIKAPKPDYPRNGAGPKVEYNWRRGSEQFGRVSDESHDSGLENGSLNGDNRRLRRSRDENLDVIDRRPESYPYAQPNKLKRYSLQERL